MNSTLRHSFVKYGLVGLANTACGVGAIIILLHVLECGYWSSTLLGNGMAMVLSYLLNSKFTFQSNQRDVKNLFLFLAVSLLAYGISYSLSLWIGSLFLSHLSLVKTISALGGSGLYTMIGYVGHRFITFRSRTV